MNQSVADHYTQKDMLARLRRALEESYPVSKPLSVDDLAAADHLHARGVAATQSLATGLKPHSGDAVLDVGCGVGGPARWLADKFNCHVTGIDITPEYHLVSQNLNFLLRLKDKVQTICADAVALPFGDASFDIAYSQYVIMNVEDWTTFFNETSRILRPGSRYMISAVTRGAGPPPQYPLPWAPDSTSSHLLPSEILKSELEKSGLMITHTRDCTDENLSAYRRAVKANVARDGSSSLNPQLFMGTILPEAQENSAVGYQNGALNAIEILCHKR
tara:strand:+ start:1437 stop:2261 length:825 start_codon:yes stop_codon:yes gene_type:complete